MLPAPWLAQQGKAGGVDGSWLGSLGSSAQSGHGFLLSLGTQSINKLRVDGAEFIHSLSNNRQAPSAGNTEMSEKCTAPMLKGVPNLVRNSNTNHRNKCIITGNAKCQAGST